MSAKTAGKDKDSLAAFVDNRLNEISDRMTLTEMALRMGLASPNYISMIRAGRTKMALTRVAEIAEHLEVDVKELFMMALRQHFPNDVIALMRYVFNSELTEAEAEILELAREHLDTSKKLTDSTREKLVEVFRDNTQS